MGGRQLTVAILGAAALLSGAFAFSGGQRAAAQEITVHKTPTCGCCGAWVDHLRENGFDVTVHDHDELSAVKAKLGVPAPLRSCHTAVIEGFVVEGHVPARDIRRLLEERPALRGLSVPGMPIGSPGMEMGDRKDPFAVIGFGPGESTVFSRY